MTYSLSDAAVPVFAQMLDALSAVLAKAEAFAGTKKIEPAVLLNARLAPDMLPLVRQVQIASDFAHKGVARLAAQEVLSRPDDEASFEALRARIAHTLSYIASVPAEAVNAGATREVSFPAGPQTTLTLPGAAYLTHFAMPNFYFHVTTAYDILRHLGLEIGKRDFMGTVPGLQRP